MSHSAPRGLAAADADALHILVLADRDWTHPQAGGSGTNLIAQVTHWLDWGHRVTVVACAYTGAIPHERAGNLTVHRIGGRATVFPRATWRLWRGLVPDPDVVLEIFNGVSFLAPVWVRAPRVTLIHHVHRDHYVAEMGRKGHVAAVALETLPLRSLYRRSRFVTMSQSSADQIAANGVPRERIRIITPGIEIGSYSPGKKARVPTLLYLGRLKRYKRPEMALAALEAIPHAVLEIAGDGDHRKELAAQIEARGLGDRVHMHGHVDEATKVRLLQRAWVHVMPSSNEGWGLTVNEAGACETPTVAMASGGLRESVIDGQTGLLAHDLPGFVQATRRLIEDSDLRQTMGSRALERAHELSWARHARTTLDELCAERDRRAAPKTTRWPTTRTVAGIVGGANVVALVSAAAVLTAFQTVAILVLQLVFLAALAAVLRRPATPSAPSVSDRTA